MAILNPRFLIPGDHPGEALHWTLVTFTSAERLAGFGPPPSEAIESFERWFKLWRDLSDIDIAVAVFDPLAEAVEDFEEAWLNNVFYFELPNGRIIRATFQGKAIDDIETDWGNDAFAWIWADIPSTFAIFNGEPLENFESHWKGNEDYLWTWDDVDAEAAQFDWGTKQVEDFEGYWEEPD